MRNVSVLLQKHREIQYGRRHFAPSRVKSNGRDVRMRKFTEPVCLNDCNLKYYTILLT